MIRNIEARIRKLEAEIGTLLRPVDRIVGGNSEEECEAKRRAVIAEAKRRMMICLYSWSRLSR